MTEQLALVPVPGAARRRGRPRPVADRPVADQDPVALVAVDTPLPHLDRPFEYLVPAELDQDARPGVRVRVRFAGRDHDGFLLERRARPEHQGRLAPLRTVVSPEPVLTPPVAQVAREVADHYGGTVADVLRLAVPPRHARAERAEPSTPDPARTPADGAPGRDRYSGGWDRYPAGPALLRRLEAGQAPAAAWSALPGQPPGQDWADAVVDAVHATLLGGRGSVVVLPDHRDVDLVHAALEDRLGSGSCARLTADLGPEARYRAFLGVLRGRCPVAVGTRSAAWAPVPDPGLFLCWDDGDDLHAEPRSPYPHVREVLRRRAVAHRAALVLGGFARSVPVQQGVRTGALAHVVAATATVRAAAPVVVVAGEGHQEARDAAARTARIPSVAWRALRDGLAHGPVLVQVPRGGYVLALACQDCRTPVRCARPGCAGPMGVPGPGGPATCRWCGAPEAGERRCVACGSGHRRSSGMGRARTAEELGRAFPGARLISSGGDHVVARVEDEPALVVATPGAEPRCPGGYRAVALLDGWQLLERASLDAGVEALRRWAGAAATARHRPDIPAKVVLSGVPPHASVPAVEALVRWDPTWLADRELDERSELGLPPVRRHALVHGDPDAVRAAVAELVRAGHRALGEPGAGPGPVTAVVRAGGPTLPSDTRAVRARRSAAKGAPQVKVVLDAPDLAG